MLPLAILTMLAARPDTPGTSELFRFEAGDVVETYDTLRFRIHFTRAGKNAVPSADADGDGVPDHVQQVGEIYEAVLDTYTGMGFRAPVPDDDAIFDVYLVDTDFSADGSFVAETCTGDVCGGFMVQENDFAGFGYPSVTYANRLLASHELFHALQDAYDTGQGAVLAEGTAVWASEHFDASLEDLEIFSGDFLDSTDRALTTDGVGPVDPYTYGSSILWEYLSQALGVDFIEALLASVDGTEALSWTDTIDDVIAAHGGTDFADAWASFALATLSIGARADDTKGFSDAADLPTLTLKATEVPVKNPSFLLFPASFVTLGVTPGDRTELRVALAGEAANTDGLRLALVPLTSTSAGDAVSGGLDLSVDTAGVTTVAVQIVNTHLEGNSARPRLCIGSSAEVDACLAEGEAPPPPDGVNPPAPGGCTCASSSDGASAGALVLTLALLRRRRQKRSSR